MRQARILEEVRRTGGARVAQLTALLGVSDMTVRRDLEMLDRKGLLSKVHGGATAMDTASAIEPGFEVTSQREISEKEAIAARAAQLVRPGHGDRDHRRQHHLDAGPASRRHRQPHRGDQLAQGRRGAATPGSGRT